MIITLDPLGWQKPIAEQVSHGGVGFTCAVKNSHRMIHEALKNQFGSNHEREPRDAGFRQEKTRDKGNERVEGRCYPTGPAPDHMQDLLKSWPNAPSIGRSVNITTKESKETSEIWYYTSNHLRQLTRALQLGTKSLWHESMHCVRDIVFSNMTSAEFATAMQ